MSSRLTSFKSQTPQGDGNHSFDLSSSRKVSVVSNHKPRKGTETILRPRSFSFFISSCFKSQTPQGDGNAILDCTLDVGAQLVSNHKPRKGTETLSWPRSFSFFISSCFKSQTPQGDGNKLVRCPVRQKFGEGFKSQTPQGDGNGQFHFCFLLFGCLFQITNPARGRKPLEIAVRQCHVAKRFKSQTPQGDGNNISRALHQSSTGFQITNPARGRKRYLPFLFQLLQLLVSNHKPRKGTETLPPFPLSALATSRFKSQTPQGDGNPIVCVHNPVSFEFQITNPARGRKRDKQGRESYYHLRQFQITNPARGRKQVAAEMECRVLTLVSNHKPRKGTETFPKACASTPSGTFQITNPARGRKPVQIDMINLRGNKFQITNPARGRKLSVQIKL